MIEELDINLPIFPLSGAILFPNSNLPLNIFEERYLEMINYALSKNKKIGMIQKNKEGDEIYKIGCCGRITSFHETNDGRYLINLLGLNFFKIIKEVETKNKFRIFKVKFEENKQFDQKEIKHDKSLILNKFKFFVKKTNLETSLDSIDSINYNDLVKILAMSCPFTTSEKQLLLESKNTNALADKLLTLFDFYNNNYDNIDTIN